MNNFRAINRDKGYLLAPSMAAAPELVKAYRHENPNHETIAAFRKSFLVHIEALFIDVLKVARMMRINKLGRVALDVAKVQLERDQAEQQAWLAARAKQKPTGKIPATVRPNP